MFNKIVFFLPVEIRLVGIYASTSAVLSIKKPETCVSGAFGGDNKTRRALPVIAKRVSLLKEQAPLMMVISSSTIVLWHLATEDYCGIKKEVRLDFLFWWDSMNDS